MSTTHRPGRPVSRRDAAAVALRQAVSGTDLDSLRGMLRGPLHLASPLRIGDLIIEVKANSANSSALDVWMSNAVSKQPPVLVWTIP